MALLQSELREKIVGQLRDHVEKLDRPEHNVDPREPAFFLETMKHDSPYRLVVDSWHFVFTRIKADGLCYRHMSVGKIGKASYNGEDSDELRELIREAVHPKGDLTVQCFSRSDVLHIVWTE